MVRWPAVLVVQLKRFTYTLYSRAKISTSVNVPATACFQTAGAGPSPTYDLFGVANHSGGLGGGHYYAFCQHPTSHAWRECNDSQCAAMTLGDLQVCGCAGVVFCCVLLCFVSSS